MISKTKINSRMNNKTNPILAETIFLAKKNEQLDLARKLAVPTRKRAKMNVGLLDEIKEDKIIYPGKILGTGEINKKKTIIALSFSEQAIDKLKKAGCEIKTIHEEMIKNPKLTGYKLI
jgi:large subunit ribosomal protein L18e